MVEPNLESLIKDLYNHARHDLSEDLVAALLETAKKLPTTNEQLLAVRLSGLVNRELLLNPKHPAPELLNLARFIITVRTVVANCFWRTFNGSC